MARDPRPEKSCTLEVRVQPGAKSDAIERLEDGRLRVRLTARPVEGKANDALIVLIARMLKVSRGSVAIARGHRSRDKAVRVEGLSTAEALSRLSG